MFLFAIVTALSYVIAADSVLTAAACVHISLDESTKQSTPELKKPDSEGELFKKSLINSQSDLGTSTLEYPNWGSSIGAVGCVVENDYYGKCTTTQTLRACPYNDGRCQFVVAIKRGLIEKIVGGDKATIEKMVVDVMENGMDYLSDSGNLENLQEFLLGRFNEEQQLLISEIDRSGDENILKKMQNSSKTRDIGNQNQELFNQTYEDLKTQIKNIEFNNGQTSENLEKQAKAIIQEKHDQIQEKLQSPYIQKYQTSMKDIFHNYKPQMNAALEHMDKLNPGIQQKIKDSWSKKYFTAQDLTDMENELNIIKEKVNFSDGDVDDENIESRMLGLLEKQQKTLERIEIEFDSRYPEYFELQKEIKHHQELLNSNNDILAVNQKLIDFGTKIEVNHSSSRTDELNRDYAISEKAKLIEENVTIAQEQQNYQERISNANEIKTSQYSTIEQSKYYAFLDSLNYYHIPEILSFVSMICSAIKTMQAILKASTPGGVVLLLSEWLAKSIVAKIISDAINHASENKPNLLQDLLEGGANN